MSPEPSEPGTPDPSAPAPTPIPPAPRRVFLGAAWVRVALIVVIVAAVAAIAVGYALHRFRPQSTALEVQPAPPRTAPASPGVPVLPRPAPAPPPAAAPAAPAAPAAKRAPPSTPSAPAPAATSQTTTPSSPPSPVTRAATKSAPSAPATKGSAPAATRPAPDASPGGPYWLQVGAFRDEKRAAEVAERLRADGFTVEESVLRRRAGAGRESASLPPPAAEDRFDVFVSGATLADVKAKLEGKSVSASPVAGGAVLTPSLLRAEADAVSRELTSMGWRVSVRRASPWTETARAPERPAAAEETLHRVRVGSFPNRAAAEQARRALKERGYTTFVARGEP